MRDADDVQHELDMFKQHDFDSLRREVAELREAMTDLRNALNDHGHPDGIVTY